MILDKVSCLNFLTQKCSMKFMTGTHISALLSKDTITDKKIL